MVDSIAGIKRRFFAFILDILILGVLGGAVIYPMEISLNQNLDELVEVVQQRLENSQEPTPSSVLLLFIYSALKITLWSLYFIVFIGKCGQTPGKKLLGLKVFKSNGQSVNYKTAGIRALVGYPISVLTFGLGFIWALLDKNSQCLHDKIADTIVIKIT
ncbi:MAG: RDD family protein [Nitrospinales bacterium]